MRAPADRPPLRVLFVDDGGVLNDNERRAPEWRRLVGEFFAPRLGGTPEAWAVANAAAIEDWWRRWLVHAPTAISGVSAYWRAEDRRWLTQMCAQVGASVADDEVDDLVGAAHRYITPRVASAYPEAAQAMRDLARAGIALHTASGGSSLQLHGYLSGMGIRDVFDRLYGPDLIDRFKTGTHYYAALLADSGVDPAEAAAVDDSVAALDWAAACGLRTIHVAREGGDSGRHETIGSLTALPLIL